MTTSAPDHDSPTATATDIQGILVAQAGAEEAIFVDADEIPLDQLGMDSLAALELEATVADRFGVELPAEPLTMSVTELVQFINTHA